jgi:CheY-like chemotaxis protein
MESFEHTVLIIDDTPEHLELISKLMRQADFHVITARDGKEGFSSGIARASFSCDQRCRDAEHLRYRADPDDS